MLAKLALRNASFTAAALAVGDFTLRTIVPTLAFYDFETFFSCNHKPVNWTDTINGMKAINTLSVGWTADQLLSLYTLTKNETWLQQGELVLGVFNLFQQVGLDPTACRRRLSLGCVAHTDGACAGLVAAAVRPSHHFSVCCFASFCLVAWLAR